MGKSNGIVKIFLSREAVIPTWIMRWLEEHTDYFSVEFENFGGSSIRVLKLVGGQASFCYPNRDDVTIRLPGENHPWASGFYPTAILQITNGDGSVVEQNRLLCPSCHTTTGKVSHHKLGEKPATVFRCTGCAQEWEH